MAKRSSGGGGFGRFVAFLLALIVGAGVVLGIIYRKQVAIMWGDLMRYFKRVDDEVPDEDDGTTDENGATGDTAEKHDNMLISDVESNGLTVEAVPLLASDLSEQAESGLTLTATVKPDEATDKSLDWTVEFVDASNTWANGKTASDYVTITPTEDGSNVATLECLLPFGAQLVAKATSRSNPDVYATCTLDYYARITGASFRIGETVLDMAEATMGVVASTTSAATHLGSILSGGVNYYITDEICGTNDFECIYNTTDYTIPLSAEELEILDCFKIRVEGGFALDLYNENSSINAFRSPALGIPAIYPFGLASDSYDGMVDIKYFALFTAYFNKSTVFSLEDFELYKADYGAEYLAFVNDYTDPAIIVSFEYEDDMNDVSYALSLSYQKDYFDIAVTGVETDNTEVVL